MPNNRKLLALVPGIAATAATVSVGLGVLRLARRVWRSNVDYRGPYRAPLPAAPQPDRPRPARRAILFVLDGLRADTAMTMPTLVGLRERGNAFIARVGQPSLSLPGWTAMLTGAWQEVSGVTSNWYPDVVPIDSVISLAHQHGLRTAVVGDRAWRQLFGAHTNHGAYVRWEKKLGAGEELNDPQYIVGPANYYDDARIMSSDGELAAAAARIWRVQQPELMIVHLSTPDNFGHGYGGTSPQYINGAAFTDGLVRDILQVVDFSDTAVVVTSDHGHLDEGGHGGAEEIVVQSPLILAGAGVAADDGDGYSGTVSQVDIAPTLCALLGLPLPAHNQGRPLAEHLTLEVPQQARLALNWLAQETAFYQAYGERLQANEPIISGVSSARLEEDYQRGDYETVLHAAHQGIRTLRAEARAWREERLRRERWGRTPIAVALTAAPLVAAILLTPGNTQSEIQNLKSKTAAAVAANALYTALYFGRGYRWSLSMFRTDDRLEQFFRERLLDTAISNAASSFVAGLVDGQAGRDKSRPYNSSAGLQSTLVAMSIAGGQAAAFYRKWGANYTWHLPDYATAFKFYLDITLVGGFALAAPLAVGAGWLGGWLRRRVSAG